MIGLLKGGKGERERVERERESRERESKRVIRLKAI
jgi:hypothetical protein